MISSTVTLGRLARALYSLDDLRSRRAGIFDWSELGNRLAALGDDHCFAPLNSADQLREVSSGFVRTHGGHGGLNGGSKQRRLDPRR
jgi:hypothetical protein